MTKNRGRGEGKGEEETRSGKIRLRGPESGPRVNCACSKSDLFFMCAVQTLSSIPCCVLLLKDLNHPDALRAFCLYLYF